MADVHTFSVIKFFNAFQKEIDKINKYPISSDNLIVHKDLVNMLGDEDIELTYPFASLAVDRPRTFEDLLFGLDLYDRYFTLSFDQQFPLEITYESLRWGEEELAVALSELLVSIANGQVVTLTTLIDEEDAQATEILYRQKDAKLYTVLRTFAYFDKKSKDESANYSTAVHKNSFDIPEIRFEQKLLEQLVPYSLDSNTSNRKPFADLDQPLTKEKYKKNVDTGSQIWAQHETAKWFPGYGPKESTTKIEKLVSYAYYRYIEVITVLALAVTLLTWGSRTAPINILVLAGIIVFAVVASLYLNKVGRAMWVFGVLAYAAAVGYIAFFTSLKLHDVWSWIVAILALEPVIEMLIADFYTLFNRNGPKSKSKKNTK